jgi:hypothetical protein
MLIMQCAISVTVCAVENLKFIIIIVSMLLPFPCETLFKNHTQPWKKRCERK